MFVLLTGLIVGLTGPASSATASTTLTVTTPADSEPGDPNIACPASTGEECTLREAVASAGPGDSVFLPDLGANYVLTDDIELTKSITIIGESADSAIITPDPNAATNDHRFFTVDAPDADIEFRNLTLRDSQGAVSGDSHGGFGAAISAAAFSSLEIKGVTFRNNSFTHHSGGRGGAISIADSNGHVEIDGATFVGNSALAGGAIYVARSHGDFAILNTEFVDNHATGLGTIRGGAIRAADVTSPVSIFNSRFVTNNSDGVGGALSAGGPTHISLAKSTVRESVSVSGTIALEAGAHIELENSTLIGNVATTGGSVLQTTGGGNAASFNFVTIADHDDAFAIEDDSAVSVQNSAVSDTSGCGLVDVDATVVTDSSVLGCGGTDAADLQLSDEFSHGYLVPLNSSPLVGHIDDGCPSTDQRGVARTDPCTAGAIDTAGVVCETPIPRDTDVTCSLDVALVDEADVLIELNPILFDSTVQLTAPGTGSVTFSVANDAPDGDVVISVASGGQPYVHTFSVAPHTENGSPGDHGTGSGGSSGAGDGGSDNNGGGSTSTPASNGLTDMPDAAAQDLPPILPVTGAPIVRFALLGLGFVAAGLLLWRTSAREKL